VARGRGCVSRTDQHLDVVARSVVTGPDASCALPAGATATHRVEVTSWSELAVEVHVVSALAPGPVSFPGPAPDWTLRATIDGQDFTPYGDERDLDHPAPVGSAPAGPSVQTLEVTPTHWPYGGGEDTHVPAVRHHLRLR